MSVRCRENVATGSVHEASGVRRSQGVATHMGQREIIASPVTIIWVQSQIVLGVGLGQNQ